MRCPNCRSPMVRGRTTKTRLDVRVCVYCNRVWQLDWRRGGYKEIWIRQRPEFLIEVG